MSVSRHFENAEISREADYFHVAIDNAPRCDIVDIYLQINIIN